MLRSPTPVNDLAQQVARLSAENAALRSAIVAEDIVLPAAWGLTKSEALIFRSLLKNDLVTKKALAVALYGREGTAGNMKGFDVFMLRIRSKTAEANVKIETVLRVGYRLLDREAWAKSLSPADLKIN